MSENFNQMAIEKIEETETFQPLDKGKFISDLTFGIINIRD